MRLSTRIAVTAFVPLGVLFLGDQVVLPGIPGDYVDRFGLRPGSHASLGVFALGIAPIVTAYWLVEVTALLVPRWAHLRHGSPEGRAKLDRAARLVTLLLATVQAFGMALSLEALGAEAGFSISRPIVMVSLMAGVAFQFVVARLLSRFGILNGFVALFAANLLRQVSEDAPKRLAAVVESSHANPRTLISGLIALAATATVTWSALRGGGLLPREGARHVTTGRPYRDVREISLDPWIPIPSSSFQPFFTAGVLLMLPTTFASLNVPDFGLARIVQGDAATPILLVLTVALMVGFARVMHRPSEIMHLAGRSTGVDEEVLTAAARAAWRRTLVPSALFFVAIVLASAASVLGTFTVAILTVITMDVVHAVREAHEYPELVPMWEEQRASAVPVLLSELGQHGIVGKTQGMAFLGFWQVFAPFAPARILVKEADVGRAFAALRKFGAGNDADPSGERVTHPVQVPSDPWPLAHRTKLLAACACAAGGAALVHWLPA